MVQNYGPEYVKNPQETKAFKCRKCKEIFTNDLQYWQHREHCLPEKQFICQQCNREYASAQSFYNHRRYECGKPPMHRCPFCDYQTRLKGNLKSHMGRRHAEKIAKGEGL